MSVLKVEYNYSHKYPSNTCGFSFTSWTNTVRHFVESNVWFCKMADCVSSRSKEKSHNFEGCLCVNHYILLLKHLCNHTHFIGDVFVYSPKRPIQGNVSLRANIIPEAPIIRHPSSLSTGLHQPTAVCEQLILLSDWSALRATSCSSFFIITTDKALWSYVRILYQETGDKIERHI